MQIIGLAGGRNDSHLIGISELDFLVPSQRQPIVDSLVAVPIPLVDLGEGNAAQMLRHLPHILSRPSWLLDELLFEVLNLLGREDLVLGLLPAKVLEGLGPDASVEVNAARLVLHSSHCGSGSGFLLILLGFGPSGLNPVQVFTH